MEKNLRRTGTTTPKRVFVFTLEENNLMGLACGLKEYHFERYIQEAERYSDRLNNSPYAKFYYEFAKSLKKWRDRHERLPR